MSRVLGVFVLLFALGLTEWAFRFELPKSPVDSFLRALTLVLDCFLLVIALTMIWKKESIVPRLNKLGKSYPRTFSIFIGLLIAFCILVAVEIGARLYFVHGYSAPYTEQTYWEPGPCRRDSTLGSSLAPNTVISHAYIINDSLIYKQHYRIDSFGRRENPKVWPDSVYKQFAMITGCSFAFGYGLTERQTLAHYFDSIAGYRSYNYGVSGHGTQQTLALLQSRSLKNEISEANGMLIHLFIDDHIKRLIGSRRLISLWASHYPYYYLKDGELKRDRSFNTGRYLLSIFYRVMSKSSFIALFDIDIPWYVSDSHLKLFGAVLREAKKEFQSQYPKGRFLVIIGPKSKLAPRIHSELKSGGIEVLDLSNLLNKEDKRYKIHWTEAHPNERYYHKIAVELKRYLGTEITDSAR